MRRVRCSSAPHAHPLLPEACSHARTCGSWSAQALQSTMPRNKGIGAKRKKKMPPPKKPEGADAMSMPDNANEKPTTTPGGRSPLSDEDSDKDQECATSDEDSDVDATKSDTALDVLIDDSQTSSDAMDSAEYTYKLKQRALAVKTRARGSAASKEETMQAEIDYLKAQLAHKEQEVEVLEKAVELSEVIIAKAEECDDRRVRVEDHLRHQIYLALRGRLSVTEVDSE